MQTSMIGGSMHTTRTTSLRRRLSRVLIGPAALALLASACGGADALAESAFENVVERAVEADTGEDIDVSFDADGEDGVFSIEVAGQTITVDSEEGTVDMSGFDIGGTDADTGDSFNLQTSQDDEGRIVTEWEDDDGSSGFSVAAATAPDGWPSELSAPADATDVAYIETALDGTVMITASFSSNAPVDGLVDSFRQYFSDWDEVGSIDLGAVKATNFSQGEDTGMLQYTEQAGEPTYWIVMLSRTA